MVWKGRCLQVGTKNSLYDFDSAPTQIYTHGEDACPAGFIKYIGSEQSCLISVDNTTGDISSAIGVLGSEAADANFTIGSTPGTIDVSNAAVNTFGEVADFINSLDDYEFIPWAALRGDSMNETGGALDELSGTQAKSASYDRDAGVALYWDTSIVKHDGIVISNMKFGAKTVPGGGSDEGIYDEYGALNELFYYSLTPTYGGTATLKLYELERKTEIEKASFVLAASTNATEIKFKDTLGHQYRATPGRRIYVRFTDDTSCSVMTKLVLGRSVLQVP